MQNSCVLLCNPCTVYYTCSSCSYSKFCQTIDLVSHFFLAARMISQKFSLIFPILSQWGCARPSMTRNYTSSLLHFANCSLLHVRVPSSPACHLHYLQSNFTFYGYMHIGEVVNFVHGMLNHCINTTMLWYEG